MHYLIDGHNLIAKMEGIRLSDPDDEAQLIVRLRRWTAANHKRRVTVYFDGGLPGGPAHDLSGSRLKVYFASSGRTADALLIQRIRRVKNPPEFTLVSSDREIQAAAEKRRMPVISSDGFASEIAEEAEARAQPQPEPETDDPLLTPEEVALWMEMFGPEPEIPRQAPRPRKKGKGTEEQGVAGQSAEDTPGAEAARPLPRDPRELKETGAALTEEEVALWLEMFGPETEEEEETAGEGTASAEEIKKKRRQRRKAARGEMRPADRLKESGAGLSADEVDEWLDIFADRDERDET